jgi:hypothetical protein
MTNKRCASLLAFEFRYSFVIRHSSFVILFIRVHWGDSRAQIG